VRVKLWFVQSAVFSLVAKLMASRIREAKGFGRFHEDRATDKISSRAPDER
jgi:hypothetical protein